MPSAATIAAAAALVIVLLSDKVAPGTTTTKVQCHLRHETDFAQDPPYRGRTYNQAVMRR
jgi:hypothetical protein